MAEPPAQASLPTRLHRNHGRYCGERISIISVLECVRRAANRTGWRICELTQSGGCPVWLLTRPPQNRAGRPRRIYLSAGIHGDEPAGPLAMLQLIEASRWPAEVELVMFPCLNPFGLERNNREGAEGLDYNRDYRNPRTALVQRSRELAQDATAF